MLSTFIVCMLVVLTGAKAVTKPNLATSAMHSMPKQELREDREPCKGPRYFTFDQVDTYTYVEGGSLKVVYDNFEGAYDAIAEKYSVKLVLDFFNGTVDYLKVIEDYKEGVRYEIEKRGDAMVCYVYDIEGEKFPVEYRIPEDAKFVGESVLGDRDLVVESWYFASEGNSKHNIKTVTAEGCVPVALIERKVDPETEEEIEVRDSRLFNFRLGICDPEKYFKVPEVCETGRSLKEPTPKMLKMRRHGLF